MRVSEYDLLMQAWERSFGFMMNRVVDVWQDELGSWDPHSDHAARERAADLCFNELMCALEEMGVELGQAESHLQVSRPSIDAPK